MQKKRVLIMGAAGRDFHNFNVVFRDNPQYEVVAFTATQIPNIENRKYPAGLAGKLYPQGISIVSEDDLEKLIKKSKIDEVVFSYSDVSNQYVMQRGASVMAWGADFKLLGKRSTMLKSKRPVIAVCAARTGSGKSQTTRKVCQLLKQKKINPVVIRHPMPYGDLTKQICQRFASISDLDKHHCTIEEREEYEPHIVQGTVVYAGVDYEVILKEAEKEAEIIVWDGGNNDIPFFVPDLHITVVDPHRPGDELSYFPGETNLLLADVVLINKVDTADYEDIEQVRCNVKRTNPKAVLIEAASPIYIDKPQLIRGKNVLVVEDGPTLTHGGMRYGAGVIAAQKFGAKEIINPRPWVKGEIKKTFESYPEIGALLPAIGYGKKQINDLERTINLTPCDSVVIATPVDLTKILKINKPSVRVRYELQEIGKPDLEEVIEKFLDHLKR
ncbi:MAG: cyclic 2,3-diphosphoglycerate synthase [candidate division Zixibacteria bacterium]|nr:cyclic 2,3-diphosphoglycerate synthase [candidate division Zixibacteria bacterium]